MKRRVAREKALQALFQIDMSGIEPEVALRNVLEEEEKMDAYLEQIVLGFIENQERIDGHIRENLEKWSFDRLAKVDRNILRLGVYELLFVEDVPNNVVINEAVEIAKIFGDDQSSKFINGVLSKVSQS
ncbi:transcription antitermination factor NusB [Rossellomorea vietnamensis]|uniref:Transcription antitermination factor NusB n=1 Tax=Rossellomorea vietnamensis TaxID=218284 RepID=A0ACD4C762_9BACI|nr:transcription antitermination factor NusB [Rossellomorea vietnamensis]OXS62897.1 N utilization substance protein B [Bacillus sp. DSM 27956]PRX77730.1 NusB antitermination factor [Bacillus sp. V-88]UXH44504.1 transcription antitermination factor NusB [Rossellomorea vietnamensis]WQI95847.1 transcription antitermination factor NusB [Rossellomorea vietnamensis]SLK18543.1 NusB antitermination factor [Bacillus sp. V-88]